MASLRAPLGFALAAALLLGACGGSSGTPAPGAPLGFQYALDPAVYRDAHAITPNVPTWTGGDPTSFTAVPPLPAGLGLDPVTGAIQGTPTGEAMPTAHVITAMNAAGSSQDTVTIAVMPEAFLMLASGFSASTVHAAPSMTPVKLGKVAAAGAPDGRVFFTEVDTGNVRVIDAQGSVLATPFATLQVLGGGHNGLLGLALAPDFATSATPYLYVLACVPGDPMDMTVDRMQVVRYTAAGNVGTNETVVIDDLPVSPPMGINNGGEIAFDLAGALFVSIGDVGDPANAQADTTTSLAGKILRYDVSSGTGVPAAGNPRAGDPEWCRGIRNTFGMAVHPTVGTLIGADNGPAADDELNFLQGGKNFEWMNANPPPMIVGFKIRNYATVIVPTGLAWHDGTGWGAAFANDLFLCSYEDHKIRRFEMSGADFVDVDAETDFAELELDGSSNHPLDLCRGPDGCLYLSTFTHIYRIDALP